MDVIYPWSDHFGCATGEWGYAFLSNFTDELMCRKDPYM
jgi:hypothetical protein